MSDALYEAVDAFVESLLAGDPIDVEAFLQRHPDLGDELREELELVASLHQAADSVALDAAGPSASEATDDPPETGRAFLVAGDKLGDHVIEDLLGYGGMGEVYRAHHEHLGKTVAIKVLRRFLADDQDALTRFRDEVKAQASMSPHPNVVTAMHASEHDGRLYLVMEYVSGRDLTRVVREDGPLRPEAAAHYLRQAAEGLAHAHDAGLVHRDVKPSNLLIDAEGLVKVVDLGLARLAVAEDATDGRKSYLDELVGTLDYISPEQAKNPKHADARSDLYGLGCTLYFMLTGRAPFADRLTLKKLMAHAVDRPKPIGELRDDVPAGLVAVLDRLMEKDPDARFASAGDLADAIDELGMEPPASPDAVTRSARKVPAQSRPRAAAKAPPEAPAPEPAPAPDTGRGPWALVGALVLVAGLGVAYFAMKGDETPAHGGEPDAAAGVENSGADEALPFGPGAPRQARLTDSDDRRPKEDSAFHRVPFTAEAGTSYVVTMRSSDFDPVLVLRDENGFELSTSHDAPGAGRAAEVVIDARDSAADLVLLATAERATGRGEYLLSARTVTEARLSPGTPVTGALEEGDALYYEDDTLYDRFALRVATGETYVVQLSAHEFSPAVFIETADRRRLTQSQATDIEGEARTVFDAESDGLVYVVANLSSAPGPDGTTSAGGAYTLSVDTQLSGNELLNTTGLLAEGDRQARDESFYDAHAVTVVAGNTYVITMRSEDFDTYVLLVDPETEERLAANDDAFGTDSRLVWTAPVDGHLEVWANSYQAGDTGQYQIQIRELTK